MGELSVVSSVATAHAKALAEEVSAHDVEQVHFLLARGDDSRAVVLVTTSDEATERLLEFLDSQMEAGR